MAKQKILDLNKHDKVINEMKKYLELECPHLGSKPISIRPVLDYNFRLFEGEDYARVLVYDVKLDNTSEAFGTVGGMTYPHQPPYFNVFPKPEIKDAETAAKMHFYWEAINRYGHTSFFIREGSLEELAEMLELPLELRRKNK